MQKLVSMENKHGLHTREEFGGATFQIMMELFYIEEL